MLDDGEAAHLCLAVTIEILISVKWFDHDRVLPLCHTVVDLVGSRRVVHKFNLIKLIF